MKRKSKNKELSSPRLKGLQKDFVKLEKAGKYLELEMKKLKKEKEILRIKIKKEKQILNLKAQIKRVKKRKS